MSKPHLATRTLLHILRSIPFVLLVLVGVPIFGMATNEVGKLLGLKTVPVEVVGTGSMYPSLYWSVEEGGPEDPSLKLVEEYRSRPHLYRRFEGISFADQNWLGRQLDFGDMVAFKSTATAQILSEEGKDQDNGFIKRIIAIPGDTIELRDGFVYRNGVMIEEPYLTSPRSTYGGTTLKDCSPLSVGPGEYFVMGDNRKLSSDSRFELGLVKESDIEFHLPLADQTIYRSLYRDTSGDGKLLGTPSLASSEFLAIVNQKRQELGVAPLTIRPSLNRSTALRGEKLLFDENTSYSMKQAVASAGYSNIILGEFVSYGHFSAQELLENLLYHKSTAGQILNPQYSDLGISAVNLEVNNCPTQVIVGHLGGYVPADYDESTVESWQRLRDNLTSVIPTWERAIGQDQVDQTKLSELLTILKRRLSLTQDILSTMENRAWLTAEQKNRIEADDEDAVAAENLAKELNKN